MQCMTFDIIPAIMPSYSLNKVVDGFLKRTPIITDKENTVHYGVLQFSLTPADNQPLYIALCDKSLLDNAG